MNNIENLPDPIVKCESDLIYSPSDDTYLIIDYIKKKLDKHSFDGIGFENINYILDMGTGTGIIPILLLYLLKKIPKCNLKIYASDILEEVLTCAKNNENLNGFNSKIHYIHSNLFKSFPNSLKNLFDIIIFNPPYLPPINENNFRDLSNKKDFCWNGGKWGIEIFKEFLNEVREFLNLTHECYIYYISSSRGNQKKLNNLIEEKRFKNQVLEKKHIFFEDIILNRLIPSDF